MNTLTFNVIVTCATKASVLKAIERKDEVTGYHKKCVGGFQVMFDIAVQYSKSESRYAVMQKLKAKIREYMACQFNLGESDLHYVSTAANWREWERTTGRNYDEEYASNRKFKSGKFVFGGFHKQMRWLDKRGIDFNYWSMKVVWEHKHKGRSFESFIREETAKEFLKVVRMK